MYDKAGNSTTYTGAQLAGLGIQNSFSIVDRSAGANAFVTAPASVREGDGSAALSLTLKGVGATTVNANVTMSFATESTATNGSDVSMSAFSGSYSIAQSSTGNYVITLPSASIVDDMVAEGAKVLAIRVSASGRVFDSGTDSTIVRIALIDNDIAGTAQADVLTGTAGRDDLHGGDDNDVLSGDGGGDRLFGDGGDDSLDGGSGIDMMQGGRGDDVYFVDATGDSVIEAAWEGEDRVFASVSYTLGAGISVETLTTRDPGAVTAINFVGNEIGNTLVGNEGANILNGHGGADVLVSFGGNDVLIGGDGAANTLQGGTGDDIYYVSAAGDSVVEFAGEGSDTVNTVLAVYALAGNVENLVYTGTAAFIGLGDTGANVIVGAGGADILNGQSGSDILVGLGGDDVLIGGTGSNTMQGGAGNDRYYMTSAQDTIMEAFGEGYDTVVVDFAQYTMGSNVEALIYNGAGAFVGIGNTGADVIAGAGGADDLSGLNGNDTLMGHGGADLLTGGAGADLLNGGAGSDRLTGGSGADQFVFADTGVDTITDFAAGNDRILLDHLLFSALGVGALASSAFARGTTALNADERILYDPNSGALLYDADGSGSGAAVQFGVVSVVTGTLMASDFLVV